MTFGGCRHTVCADCQPSMCPRTDPDVVAVAPVNQIVPAFRPGAGVVGDFVSRKTCLFSHFLSHLKKLRTQLRIGCLELSRLVQRKERGPFLDGELIQRQMVRGERDCLFKFQRPVGRCLPRTCVDQVKGKSGKCFPGDLDCGSRCRCIMQTPEKLQIGIVQGLHAKRNPVHASSPVALEPVRLDRGRVRLQRYFHIFVERPPVRHRLQQSIDRRRIHQRGRATPQKDRLDGLVARQVGEIGQFPFKGSREAFLINRLMANV